MKSQITNIDKPRNTVKIADESYCKSNIGRKCPPKTQENSTSNLHDLQACKERD